MEISGKYDAVVIGVSAGGIAALDVILPALTSGFCAAVLIVQHMAADGGDFLIEHFGNICGLPVMEAVDKEEVRSSTIYFAPANYHLLVERQKTMALSTEAKVNFSRPSIDVLFSSAADAYCRRLAGIILTGANHDGAAGLADVKSRGGFTIVQSPETAEVPIMPESALAATRVDKILPLWEIGPFLLELVGSR